MEGPGDQVMEEEPGRPESNQEIIRKPPLLEAVREACPWLQRQGGCGALSEEHTAEEEERNTHKLLASSHPLVLPGPPIS